MSIKASSLLVAPIFLVITLVAGYLMQHHPLGVPEPDRSTVPQTYAQSQAALGVMTLPEALRWEHTNRAIESRKIITTPELDWLLLEIPKPAPSSDPALEATRRLELMMALNQAKTYSPLQKERIYAATIRYLTGPETNDKIGALAVMRHLRASRAVAGITPLLTDPNPCVRLAAKRTLQAIAG